MLCRLPRNFFRKKVTGIERSALNIVCPSSPERRGPPVSPYQLAASSLVAPSRLSAIGTWRIFQSRARISAFGVRAEIMQTCGHVAVFAGRSKRSSM